MEDLLLMVQNNESEKEYLMKTITGITELDAFFIFMLLHDTLSP